MWKAPQEVMEVFGALQDTWEVLVGSEADELRRLTSKLEDEKERGSSSFVAAATNILQLHVGNHVDSDCYSFYSSVSEV